MYSELDTNEKIEERSEAFKVGARNEMSSLADPIKEDIKVLQEQVDNLAKLFELEQESEDMECEGGVWDILITIKEVQKKIEEAVSDLDGELYPEIKQEIDDIAQQIAAIETKVQAIEEAAGKLNQERSVYGNLF